ncbi:MAG: T9SS type A sorting domain-containing protein [Crocinitomicaceae bacterium]|nr:T9SS type A sorting domain-containing protein [Crocinitomicaceae bacterium]
MNSTFLAKIAFSLSLFFASVSFGQRCNYTCGTGCPTIPLTAGPHTIVYCTPGSCTFTVPSYVNSISVEVYGAGGGGGGVWSRSNTDHSWGSDACAGGGGGGGGGFTTKSFSVTAGLTYTVTVGQGGAGGTASSMSSTGINVNSGTPGATGGTSSFVGNGENLQASGGTGGNSSAAYRPGSYDNSQYSHAPGGIGGTGTGGTTSYTGGRGSFGFPNGSRDHSSAGGGCAGNNGDGQMPRITTYGTWANNAGNTAPNTANERRIAGQGGTCFSSTAGNGGDGFSRGATNGANAGNNGIHVGGGGGGALSHNHGSSAVSETGGNGAHGMVVITFFSTLGVNLSNFNVLCESTKRIINWETIIEKNSSHFIVEKSRDGYNWVSVETLNGAGNSNSNHFYSISDDSPMFGVIYYRLKQYDYNGVSTIYGPLISDCYTQNSIIAYPNPAQNNFAIEVNSEDQLDGAIVITDLNGKVVLNKDVIVGKGLSKFFIDCSHFATGSYLIRLNNIEKSNSFKPIKLMIQ